MVIVISCVDELQSRSRAIFVGKSTQLMNLMQSIPQKNTSLNMYHATLRKDDRKAN